MISTFSLPSDTPRQRSGQWTPIAATSVQNSTETYLIHISNSPSDNFCVKSHPDLKLSIVFFFCACVLLPSNLLTLMEEYPFSSRRPFSQPSDIRKLKYSVTNGLQIHTYTPDKVCRPAEHLNFLPRQGKEVEEATGAIKVTEICRASDKTVGANY